MLQNEKHYAWLDLYIWPGQCQYRDIGFSNCILVSVSATWKPAILALGKYWISKHIGKYWLNYWLLANY